MACRQVVFPLRVTVAGATFASGSLSIPIVLQLLIQTQLLRTRFVRRIRKMFGEHFKFVYTNVAEINTAGLDIPKTRNRNWILVSRHSSAKNKKIRPQPKFEYS